MNYMTISRFTQLNYNTSEDVNALCTNLSFSDKNVKKIMVTSCHSGEGKTFIAMNIMRRMAKFGKTVVFVDADFRQSSLASQYGFVIEGTGVKLGLAHYLAGKAEMNDVIYQTDIEGACVVPVGRRLSNPLPLLATPKLRELLDYLASFADYVIVDSPSVGSVIDGVQIANACDSTLLVIGYNDVHRQELIDVKFQLARTGCSIMGTVINKINFDDRMSGKRYVKEHDGDYTESLKQMHAVRPRTRQSTT